MFSKLLKPISINVFLMWLSMVSLNGYLLLKSETVSASDTCTWWVNGWGNRRAPSNGGVYCKIRAISLYYNDWDVAHAECVGVATSLGQADKIGTGITCAAYRGGRLVVHNSIYNPDANNRHERYVSHWHSFNTLVHPCSNGKVFSAQKGCVAQLKEKEVGRSNSCKVASTIGNPISITTGNKIQQENILSSSSNPNFILDFSYNSLLGAWSPPYYQSIKVAPEIDSLMEVKRADGKSFVFKSVNDQWQADPDVTSKLESVILGDSSNGWKLTLKDNSIETYDVYERLVSVSKLGKQLITLSYDDAANTTTVTDNLTNTNMTLEYDPANTDKLIKVTSSSNTVYRFGYTDAGLLQYISYPDDTGTAGDNPFSEDNLYREYHYEDANNNKLLTGITDERGHRYATWVYDSEGRAISSEHANTTEKTTLDYTHQNDADDSRVTVTNALGKQTTYHFKAIHGVRKVTKVEGHQSENCASANQLTTYDENGFVASRTDWKGNLTTYVNNDRGLETSRTVAEGTPDAQTTFTVWHDDFNQPVSITETMKTTTFTYGDKGQRLTISIAEN